MSRILSLLFPIRDWLYIFQTVEYDRDDFLSWVVKNFAKRNLEKKKSLNKTPKILMLFATSAFLLLVDFLIFYLLIGLANLPLWTTLTLLFILFFLSLQLYFLYLWAASWLILPIELIAKKLWLKKARDKLSRFDNLTVIGITGSYGKTSTKQILTQLLSAKFNVLETPENINTLLGVSQVVLKKLKPEHQIFIVEMGAYKMGEIKKICNLVKPKVGIMTGLNEQHLERFGSIENTIKAKSELPNSLPKDGLLLINFDNDRLRNLDFSVELKKIGYSVDKKSDFRAESLKFSQQGSQFSLPSVKESFETKLLGKHNVLNCLPALYIANHLGISWKNLPSALTKVEPLPHRLEIIKSPANLMVIDDAYSSNPDGFLAALEVLGSLSGGQKIIVTPGIVELGEKEREIHENLGVKIAKVCNWVILVGKSSRTKSLSQGLKDAGFDSKKIVWVENLEAAQKRIPEITKPGDALLFENDLPDQY